VEGEIALLNYLACLQCSAAEFVLSYRYL